MGITPGDVDRFLPDGVQLTDGRRLEGFDVAVLATGYHTSYAWLPPHIQNQLQVQEDGLYLYRHIIPPLVPVRPASWPHLAVSFTLPLFHSSSLEPRSNSLGA